MSRLTFRTAFSLSRFAADANEDDGDQAFPSPVHLEAEKTLQQPSDAAEEALNRDDYDTDSSSDIYGEDDWIRGFHKDCKKILEDH